MGDTDDADGDLRDRVDTGVIASVSTLALVVGGGVGTGAGTASRTGGIAVC